MFSLFRVCVSALALLALIVCLPAGAQKLYWLGTLGGSWSYACGVSADGSVVVGESEGADGARRAFYYSPLSGMLDLGALGGLSSYATAVSADGGFVVGAAQRDDGTWGAFRWSLQTGMQELSTEYSSAFALSRDGETAAGVISYVGEWYKAFRWTPDRLELYLPFSTGAYGVSLDGAFAVGLISIANRTKAMRWGPDDEVQTLTDPDAFWSFALAVSADGSVIVGDRLVELSRQRAFRWDANGVRELSPPMGFTESSALATSGDASVVVGEAWNHEEGGHAVRWYSNGPPEDLNLVYAPLLVDGSFLSFAAGVSPDGRYIVGGGFNAATERWEAYLLDVDALYTISGTLELQDYVGDITAVPVTVEIRQHRQLIDRRTVYLDASGRYALTDLKLGVYDLKFSASHWLRRSVVGVVLVGTDVDNLNLSLVNGDIDGDNEVTLFDFGLLVRAFGSMPGDPKWDPNADLDGDEEVTLFDFGIIVKNFGASGDP